MQQGDRFGCLPVEIASTAGPPQCIHLRVCRPASPAPSASGRVSRCSSSEDTTRGTFGYSPRFHDFVDQQKMLGISPMSAV
ncbi:hypothetical protein IG631_12911 [Alternaria alternata]|nr:hypothetical protein IG631_12911 [Alternaria alternata]